MADVCLDFVEGNLMARFRKVFPDHNESRFTYLCLVKKTGESCLAWGRKGDMITHDCLRKAEAEKRGQQTLDNFLQQAQADRRIAVTERKGTKEILRDNVAIFAITEGIPFSTIGRRPFYDLLKSFYDAGRNNPQVPFSMRAPALNRHATSENVTSLGEKTKDSAKLQLDRKFVSIFFDATTIHKRHFIAVGMLFHEEGAKPMYHSLHEIDRKPNEKFSYEDFFQEILKDLKQTNTICVSVCTDGLPAQVFGIHNHVKKLRTNPDAFSEHEFVDILPIYIPCMNHRVNLTLLKVSQEGDPLGDEVQLLQKISTQTNGAQPQAFLHKSCPSMIKTRWLSVSMICSFVRMKRVELLTLPDNVAVLDMNQFFAVLRLDIMTRPLVELHLFFENEKTKLHQVFPALLRAFAQYKLLLEYQHFQDPVSQHQLKSLLEMLITETFDERLSTLLPLAYAVTPSGRIQIQNGWFPSCYRLDMPLEHSYKLQFATFPPSLAKSVS